MTVLYTEEYIVNRSSPGQHIKGKYVRGPVTNLLVEATWQPLNGKELLNLSELQRVKNNIKVYTEELLQVANIKNRISADVIVIEGKEFEVQTVKEYSDIYPCPHFKSVCHEINDD